MSTVDVAACMLFAALAGSHAHGTSRAGSDVDVRGVCVAPLAIRVSPFESFEQYDGLLEDDLESLLLPRLKAHPTAASSLGVRSEAVVFDVAKFLKLCAAANPNALEILFADERDWLLETPAWRALYPQRRHFLTKKVQATYLGYAMAQLKKIRTHRAWLLQPPAAKPTRGDFGLPDASTLSADDRNRIEQSIAAKIRSYGIDAIELPKPARVALDERLHRFYSDLLRAGEDELEPKLRSLAVRALDLPREVALSLDAEKRYLAALRHWEAYETWKAERNPARAELERRHGYDSKHAMHLIRLMRMGLEVLQSGELRVRRHDAEELAAIRDGALSYDELVAMAERLRASMQAAAQGCTLPADVDHAWVSRLAFEIIQLAS